MLKAHAAPATLHEAITFFADPDFSFNFFVQLRWPNGVVCPACEADKPSLIKSRRIWQCRDCRKQFSPKLGTIFEDSPIGLDKWLPALWLLVNAKNGISSYELHRALGVTQKTAWFMLGRIRLAMQAKSFERMSGEVEVDESYVGGLAKFMHRSRRRRMISGTGGKDKVAILGMLERKGNRTHSRVRGIVARNVKKHALQTEITNTVEPGAELYTDAFWSYRGLEKAYRHSVIDHKIAYVAGRVHTNGLENFWSLLKRTIKGTYVSVDPGHMIRYLDEQVFRFNNRAMKDGERFLSALGSVVGRRLTYADLIGTAVATT